MRIDGLCSKGHAAAAEELLRGGAGVECADAGGRTPLHEAAARGRLEVVARLLAAGANPVGTDTLLSWWCELWCT